MSTVTKAKSADPPVEAEAAKPAQPRSRITSLEDAAKFENMVGKKFVRKDGSENGHVFEVKNITPFWVMASDEMGSGDGNTPFVARFYIEKSRGTREAETPAPHLILGRSVVARPPVTAFMIDCEKFCEQFEETHE